MTFAYLMKFSTNNMEPKLNDWITLYIYYFSSAKCYFTVFIIKRNNNCWNGYKFVFAFPYLAWNV